VAERFGGQVLDTMGIENFISVPHTEGPKLATQLEQHVKDYDVDVMNLQQPSRSSRQWRRADRDRAGQRGEPQGAHGDPLDRCPLAADGRSGRGRIPQQGRRLCPHCDGPLFKGKRTAVIGGATRAWKRPSIWPVSSPMSP
jgi:alkyl hydroperoxide reductase subunit F